MKAIRTQIWFNSNGVDIQFTQVSPEDAEKDDKLSVSAMSVKERAKQLNKMQSETDLEKSLIKPATNSSEAARPGQVIHRLFVSIFNEIACSGSRVLHL